MRMGGSLYPNSHSMTSSDPPPDHFTLSLHKSMLRDVRGVHMYHMLEVEEAANRTAPTKRRAPRGTGGGPRRVWNAVTGSPERSTKWVLCVQDLSRQTPIRKPNKGEPKEQPL